MSKSQRAMFVSILGLVGDSTTKVVKFEQITTHNLGTSDLTKLVILPQR